VRDFTARHAVANELRYRIFERFRREGIEFPSAMRQG
jgi:small-conductance mechanosensitive channel